MEMERLRQFGIGGKGRGGLGMWFRWRGVDDKVGKGDKRDAKGSSHQPGRRLNGDKVSGRKGTGRYETGRKETVRNETGGKTMGMKATGAKAPGAKAPGAQDSQETGGKGDMLMGEKEVDIMLPDDTTAGQNTTEGIRRKGYSKVVTRGGEEDSEGVRGLV